MDPLVRALLPLQRALLGAVGPLSSVALGAYLVLWASRPPLAPLDAVVGAVALLSLATHLGRRLRRAYGTTRGDLTLFSQVVLVAYAAVLLAPGGIDGPYHPVVYAVLMLTAGFSSPVVTAATASYAVLLEAALGFFALQRGISRLLPHAVLIGIFSCLNLALFRAEIARVRRLSRTRIEQELQRMKEAARSYRLLGAPSSTVEPRTLRPGGEEERLVQSGIDEIHTALKLSLELMRQSLHLRSAVLMWLGRSGEWLHVQEAVTDQESLLPGPFGARDGLPGAALARGQTVSLVGARAQKHVPYYAAPPAVGAVCAVPVVEHGHVRGVLVVDREAREPITGAEEELLQATTRFAVRVIENERVFAQLERTKLEQGKLYRAVGALSSSTTETQVIEACVNSAREFAAFDYAVVTLFDRSAGEHEICAVSGEGAEALVGQRFRHNSGLVSMVVANRHALPYRGDYDPERQVVFTRRLVPPPMASLLVLPLLVHDRALGTLILGSHRRHAFSDAVRPTLEVLASHVAVSLSNARMLTRLEDLATTDGLTGLLNKRALIEQAERKLRSAHRYGRATAVMVCDIDHFKRVNDTYGHDVGDVVIKGLGELLRRIKRDTDVVGRFGGEEFVIVCEQTELAGAMLLAERVRAELEATTFHTEAGPLRVTCSIGVAPAPAAGTTWEPVFKATDDALYASKRAGRNRVTAWAGRGLQQGTAA
ncbi:MAG TPA: diguanylate cyclase [Polyangiaceae bacterium]|nr:diguanylate cyclase [Polyangiaceae bacterium]